MDNLIPQKEQVNFIRKFANAAAIANGAKWKLDLGEIKEMFGSNYNFVVVYNNHSTVLMIQFDDDENSELPVGANGGLSGLTKDDKYTFSEISIQNDGGAEAAIGALTVTIGRMGV